MAAAMNKSLQEKEDAKGREEHKKVSKTGGWEGKAVSEMTEEEKERWSWTVSWLHKWSITW